MGGEKVYIRKAITFNIPSCRKYVLYFRVVTVSYFQKDYKHFPRLLHFYSIYINRDGYSRFYFPVSILLFFNFLLDAEDGSEIIFQNLGRKSENTKIKKSGVGVGG